MLLTAVIIFTSMDLSGWVLNGNQSGSFEYTLDKNSCATITECDGNVTELSIPRILDGYTAIEIGQNAFKGREFLTKVTIPDSVTKIGSRAFQGSTLLEEIAVPNSVRRIESYAFYGCANLSEVQLSKNLTYMGYKAFGECNKLTAIEKPKQDFSKLKLEAVDKTF